MRPGTRRRTREEGRELINDNGECPPPRDVSLRRGGEEFKGDRAGAGGDAEQNPV